MITSALIHFHLLCTCTDCTSMVLVGVSSWYRYSYSTAACTGWPCDRPTHRLPGVLGTRHQALPRQCRLLWCRNLPGTGTDPMDQTLSLLVCQDSDLWLRGITSEPIFVRMSIVVLSLWNTDSSSPQWPIRFRNDAVHFTHSAYREMLMPCLTKRTRDQLILCLQQNQIWKATLLGAILFNPHGITEDWEVVRLNWGNSIVTVEKVREP
jgi:hypothetical protein